MPSDYTNAGGAGSGKASTNTGTVGTNKGGSDYTTAGGANNGVDITASGDPQAAAARYGISVWSFLGLTPAQGTAALQRLGIIGLGSLIGLVGVAVILAGSSAGKKGLAAAGGAAKGAVMGLAAGPEGAAVGAVAGAAGGAVGGGE